MVLPKFYIGYEGFVRAVFDDINLLQAPLSEAEHKQLVEICEKLIDEHGYISRAPDIIRRRFGLGRPVETLQSVGDSYSINKERVRQIERKSLWRMRRPGKSYTLRVFLGKAGFPEYAPATEYGPDFIRELKERVRQGSALTAEELAAVRLELLNLSVRTSICLRNENLETLADLQKKTKRALMSMPNFGRKSLVEIEQVAAEFGIMFTEQ